MSSSTTSGYESSIPFGSILVDTAAVFCSDGRFAAQTDEFLMRHLDESACDRLVVPGGPACLAEDPGTWREGEVVAESLRFLQRAHDLWRVVLIAHEDCGYYARRLGVTGVEMERRQVEDLRKVAVRIRGFAAGLEMQAFYCRRAGDKVRFDPVSV